VQGVKPVASIRAAGSPKPGDSPAEQAAYVELDEPGAPEGNGQGHDADTGEQEMSGDHLPSWREAPAKRSIVEFVTAVTDRDSADFVPEPDRRGVRQ